MKNRIVEIDNNTVAIEILYKGKLLFCNIDRVDLGKVSSIKGTWHINKNRRGSIDGVRTRIQINGIRKQVWIHNFIFQKQNPNNVIDHIDHNVLNNTRQNLREVTPKQNAQNISTILSNSRTGYRNVTIENGRFRVRIKGKSFKSYKAFEEAKKVADRERSKMFPFSSEINNKVII